MSSREWTFRVQDILLSIEKIEKYLKGLTYSDFKNNELVIDGVVRNLEIIGEAGKNIPASVRKSTHLIPW